MCKALIRSFDILLAVILLPFGFLIFVLIFFPQLFFFGRVFYVSTRIGKEGREFKYIKLASMVEIRHKSAGRAHLETWRIPLWGRFIRKTHLDEIPELFFILTSRESFVGPRPLLAEHIVMVDSPERRSLKPGWTGYSQIFLKTRGILPSRIQRRLDSKLGRELRPLLYIKIMCATFCASKRRPINPGPTINAYRQSIRENQKPD